MNSMSSPLASEDEKREIKSEANLVMGRMDTNFRDQSSTSHLLDPATSYRAANASDKPEMLSISSLVQKFVNGQEELESKLRDVETEMEVISQLNRQDVHQQLARSSTSQHLRLMSQEKAAEPDTIFGMEQTCNDLTRLQHRIEKLSSLIVKKQDQTFEDIESSEAHNDWQCEEKSVNGISPGDGNGDNENNDVGSSSILRKSRSNNAALRIKTTLTKKSKKPAEKNIPKKSVQKNNPKKTDFVSALRSKQLMAGKVLKIREKYLSNRTIVRKKYPQKKRLIKCLLCHTTLNYYSMKSHMKIHMREKPYSCLVCDQKFNLSHLLLSHMKTHKEPNPYKCTKCDKAFPTHYRLKKHMDTHSGWKPFVCSTCGKSYSMFGHLQVHNRVHTGELPYKCNICPKAFRTSYEQKTHRITHSDERHHLCSECGSTFKHKASLTNHIKKRHGRSTSNANANSSAPLMGPPVIEDFSQTYTWPYIISETSLERNQASMT